MKKSVLCIVVVLSALCGVVEAKEYTLKDCEDTIQRLAHAAIVSISPTVPESIIIKKSQQGDRWLDVYGKVIPEAYLVSFSETLPLFPPVYLVPEVLRVLQDTPPQLLVSIKCPRRLTKKEKEAFKEPLQKMTQVVTEYTNGHIVTPVLQDFMKQFVWRYESTRRDFLMESANKIPTGHTAKSLWSIRERFTDYSFQTLHITFDYCWYFIATAKSSEEETELARTECLQKQSRRFEFFIQTGVESAENISNTLAKKAEELNQMLFIYLRALLARENKEST